MKINTKPPQEGRSELKNKGEIKMKKYYAQISKNNCVKFEIGEYSIKELYKSLKDAEKKKMFDSTYEVYIYCVDELTGNLQSMI